MGNSIVFGIIGAGKPPDLYRQSPWNDGEHPHPLLETKDAMMPSSYSSKHDVLAFTVTYVEDFQHPDDADIAFLSLDDEKGRQEPHTWKSPQFKEWGPELSPNGDLVAYSSEESGTPEIWVREYPEGTKLKVSSGGGTEPCWGPQGRKLYYRDGEHLVQVEVERQPELRVQPATPLFQDKYLQGSFPHTRNYDLDSKGQRFLMIKKREDGPEPLTRLPVITDWFEVVKERFSPEK